MSRRLHLPSTSHRPRRAVTQAALPRQNGRPPPASKTIFFPNFFPELSTVCERSRCPVLTGDLDGTARDMVRQRLPKLSRQTITHKQRRDMGEPMSLKVTATTEAVGKKVVLTREG